MYCVVSVHCSSAFLVQEMACPPRTCTYNRAQGWGGGGGETYGTHLPCASETSYMIPELSRGLSLHEAGAADAPPPPPALNCSQIRVHLSTSYGRRITLHGEGFYHAKSSLASLHQIEGANRGPGEGAARYTLLRMVEGSPCIEKDSTMQSHPWQGFRASPTSGQ